MNLEKSNCFREKSNNIDKIMNKFKELSYMAQDKWSESLDIQGYEPVLLAILEYVKKWKNTI